MALNLVATQYTSLNESLVYLLYSIFVPFLTIDRNQRCVKMCVKKVSRLPAMLTI